MFVGSERTRQTLLSAIDELRQAFFSARGPSGRAILVRQSPGAAASIYSTIGETICRGLVLKNPLSKFIVARTVHAQTSQYHDQSLLCLQLCVRLVEAALKEPQHCQASIQAVVAAYEQAVEWLAEYLGQEVIGAQQHPHDPPPAPNPAAQQLPPTALPLSWSHLPTLIAIVRSILGSKPLTGMDAASVDKAAGALVEAFLITLDPSQLTALQPPPVYVVAAPGLLAARSTLLQGAVLLSSSCVTASRQLLPWPGGRVAVFDISLDVRDEDLIQAGGRALAQDAGEGGSGGSINERRVQLQRLLDMVARLAAAAVTVVACQKVIHPAVASALINLHMLPLQRVSAISLAPLCRVCCALPISTPNPPAAIFDRCLGTVGSISERVVAGRVYVEVRAAAVGGPPQPPCTLLLGAPSQMAADELKSVADTALRTLSLALQVPVVLPGGGCAEALMAEHLRRRAAGCTHWRPRLKMRAVKMVADALEEAAAGLVGVSIEEEEGEEGGAGQVLLDGTCRAAEEARSGASQLPPGAPQLPVQYIGWDHHRLQFRPVAEALLPPSRGLPQDPVPEPKVTAAHLLDLMAPKLGAIAAAVDTACAVLSLDGMLAEAQLPSA